MLTGQVLLERIQKNVGVPWQSQRSDGFSDGILEGDADAPVTGVVTSFTPTLEVLRRAVATHKNTIICREAPFYSRGERAPLFWRNSPGPPQEMTDSDPVCRAKQEFITQNHLIILRLSENWDARSSDGQLRGLVRALAWEKFHLPNKNRQEYDPRNVYFQASKNSLGLLAQDLMAKLKIHGVRVIGEATSPVRKVALTHGLLLVADSERMLREQDLDVVIAGDAVEWEAAPYFQDLVTAGRIKGLILIGQQASEEPGSGEMAEWLRSFVTEVPVEWVPAGEPFWVLA
ncbi:MAG: Nif3-like dinuclear metal center hexameric protein [Acidobacteria bacterium]|nr:Nif3-like dinuclear metal center hexameric protein [Acidobacteriota bacterium]